MLLLAAGLLSAGFVHAADFDALRNQMVDRDVAGAGIKDPRVIQAMRDTPRHEFVAGNHRANAYFDMAMAIGHGQTISPPFVVAYMTEQLQPKATDTVLEVGTGSGYQAAVLSPLVKDVYSIEIVEPLGQKAARTLKRLGYKNVHTRIGDGYQGWSEHAPFDKIIVTCSPEKVPHKLVEQLREGGRMIVPVGQRYQQMLYLFEKQGGELKEVALLPTLFVPMTGTAEEGRVVQPDPKRPTIHNGGFEELATIGAENEQANDTPVAVSPLPAGAGDDGPRAVGWHYQRQMKFEEAANAPEGTHFVTFTNDVPGRSAQALQGMAVDGRTVHELDISVWVKGTNIRPGENDLQQATVGIVFYDDNRAETGYRYLTPWNGTFPWRLVNEKVRVPRGAREAVIRIGLNGAVGELSVDGLRIQAAK